MRAIALTQPLPQRLGTWQEMAYQFFAYVPDSGQYYAQGSLEAALEQGLDSLAAEAYKYLGMHAFLTGEQQKAIDFYAGGAALHDQLGNARAAATIRANLGSAYLRKGDFEASLDANLTALAYFEQAADTPRLYVLGNNISESYGTIKRPRKALEYAWFSYRLYEAYSPGPLTRTPYRDLGNAYLDMTERDSLFLDSALYYLRLTRKDFEQVNDPFNKSTIYNNLGYVYELRWEFDSAFRSYEVAYQINRSVGRYSSTAQGLANMADIRFRQNLLKQAGFWADSAYQYMQASDETGVYSRVFDVMYALAEAEDRPADALYWYKKSEGIKDTLLNRERVQSLSELQTRYETEKKDRQIAEQERALAEAAREQQQLILGSLIGLALLVVVGVLFFYRYRLQQQARLNAERLHQQQLRIRATLSAQEDERRRLAKDLHDSVGQVLAATRLQFGAFEKQVGKANFSHALGVLDDACREVRAISHTMMPRTLETLGLAAAARELAEKLILPTGIKVEVEVLGKEQQLPAGKEIGAYRILQELVQNVLKHAQASEMHIQLLYRPQHLMLLVEDNGQGLPAKLQRDGMGLNNIRLRAEALEADFSLENSPSGQGTLGTLHIPL